jgi:alpha-glucosidase
VVRGVARVARLAAATGTSGPTRSPTAPAEQLAQRLRRRPRGRSTTTGQYYLHNFLPEQPDLNWWNEDVRAAFDDILRFWLDRGIAGFRIDVAHGDRQGPRAARQPDPAISTYNANRDDVHEVLRRWRRVVDEYDPERVLLGETWVMELDRLARFYGSGEDELHLAFNFPFTFSDLDANALRGVVEATEAALPDRAWPVWMLSNHDIVRFPTRMAGGEERRARAALFLLLTLRGTPVLYYGDELGMPQADIPPGRERDMAGRDGARTPLPWNGDCRSRGSRSPRRSHRSHGSATIAIRSSTSRDR